MSNNESLVPINTGVEPIEAEFVKAKPEYNLKLNLERTKKYTETLLDMPAGEVIKLLDDQVQVKLLLINDQILKLTEEIDSEKSIRNKAALAMTMQTLAATAAEIARAAADFKKAIGVPLQSALPNAGDDTAKGPAEMDRAAFSKLYEQLSRKK
jgi:hypothetical protein